MIVAAVEELPDDLDAQIRSDAVARLVGYAADFDAKDLGHGQADLEAVAPEVGEAHEARLLEAEEREAEAAAVFGMVEDGHGKCHGRFAIPAWQGAMLRKALSPTPHLSTGPAWTGRPPHPAGAVPTSWGRRS